MCDNKADLAYTEAMGRCAEATEPVAQALAFDFPLARWLLKLPPELGRLTSLQSLDLSGCGQITSLEPLAALTSLRFLRLSGCRQIGGLEPLAALSSLQYLDLTWCTQISGIEPLAQLTSLQSLDLFGCRQIRSLEPLASLSSLQSLNLFGCNQISDLEPLAPLTSLQYLILSGCTHISSLDPLASLASLRFVDLSGCTQISGPPIAALPQLKNKCRSVYARQSAEAVFREKQVIFLVKIADAHESSWGVSLRLTILESWGPDFGMMGKDFSVSASWDMFHANDREWSAAYAGWLLVFDPRLIREVKLIECASPSERHSKAEELIHQCCWSNR